MGGGAALSHFVSVNQEVYCFRRALRDAIHTSTGYEAQAAYKLYEAGSQIAVYICVVKNKIGPPLEGKE